MSTETKHSVQGQTFVKVERIAPPSMYVSKAREIWNCAFNQEVFLITFLDNSVHESNILHLKYLLHEYMEWCEKHYEIKTFYANNDPMSKQVLGIDDSLSQFFHYKGIQCISFDSRVNYNKYLERKGADK